MAEKTISPFGNRILVKVEEPARLSAGGIIIPDTSDTGHNIGLVKAVGEGESVTTNKGERVFHKPRIYTDERVLFRKNAGVEVSSNGEKLILLNVSDVLAIFE